MPKISPKVFQYSEQDPIRFAREMPLEYLKEHYTFENDQQAENYFKAMRAHAMIGLFYSTEDYLSNISASHFLEEISSLQQNTDFQHSATFLRAAEIIKKRKKVELPNGKEIMVEDISGGKHTSYLMTEYDNGEPSKISCFEGNIENGNRGPGAISYKIDPDKYSDQLKK